MFITLIITTLVMRCTVWANEDKDIGHIGSYPTNFFTDMVPHFVNDRPTIGILTIRLDGEKSLTETPYVRGKGYFGASYVKFIESAGARAVPIMEDIMKTNKKKLLKLLGKLNGVILPGNDVDSGDAGYYKVLKEVLSYSKKQFKKGERFPVLGICRGAQRIMLAVSGKDFIMEADGKNLTVPLKFTNEVKQSRLYGHAPEGLIKVLGKKPLAFYYLDFLLPTANFYNNTHLKKEFRLIATNTDRNGSEFVSTYEGRKLPWYGIQWQPEKAQFVFNPTLAVDHSIYSIISSQYIANFFVSEARQNPNCFNSREEEQNHLIFKDYPVYVGNITESQYEQIYTYNLSIEPAKPVTEDDN